MDTVVKAIVAVLEVGDDTLAAPALESLMVANLAIDSRVGATACLLQLLPPACTLLQLVTLPLHFFRIP